jgi:hypothetical protein
MCYNKNMSDYCCPQKQCSSPARLLFYLVCANPNCRNYDAKWHAEVSLKPKYIHDTEGDHTFLGGYSHGGQYYDLYFSINPFDDGEWVEARYGDTLSNYLCEELMLAPMAENEILQEAARRWNDRLNKH